MQPANPAMGTAQRAIQIAKTRHFIIALQAPAIQHPHIPRLPLAHRQKDHATTVQPAMGLAQACLPAEEAVTDQTTANPG